MTLAGFTAVLCMFTPLRAVTLVYYTEMRPWMVADGTWNVPEEGMITLTKIQQQ